MSANNKLILLSKDEFVDNSKQDGKPTIEGLYSQYVYLYNQTNDIINSQSLTIKELTKERNYYKRIAEKFNHSIDNKTRQRVITLLRNRYTIKEVAKEVGISESTVSRIKKAENVEKKPIPSKKAKPSSP